MIYPTTQGLRDVLKREGIVIIFVYLYIHQNNCSII